MLAGLIKRLGKIETNARNNKRSAAVSVLIAQAKLAGSWVDRTENRNANVNYAISDQSMTDPEWAERYVTGH